jgi:uncharacterized protein (DUF983 family)
MPFADYAIHFAIEAIGSLIAIAAYATHRCQDWWHRALIWMVLTILTTVITVQIVG